MLGELTECFVGAVSCISRVQELLEQEAENRKAIEDIIEEERRKVDAKTPITEEVSCGEIKASIS